MRRLQGWFIGWLCLGLAVCLPAVAQTKLDNGLLDQLMNHLCSRRMNRSPCSNA